MALILGIDPGSRKTGFGLINSDGHRHGYVASGIIRIPPTELPARLKVIFESVGELIDEYQPQQMAIEQVFISRGPMSALKLGQARGAAIVAGVSRSLDVFEYEARKIKQSVVGHGGADKGQMQAMVKHLLKLPAEPPADAADALGVALCHANSQQQFERIASATRFRRGRLV